MGSQETTEMFVNSFATPPKTIFENLFIEKASSVEDLKGSESSWFSSDHYMRFESKSMPTFKRPIKFTKGVDKTKAIEFFKRRFKEDASMLEDINSLDFSFMDENKKHAWVLLHKTSNVYFVRVWTNE